MKKERRKFLKSEKEIIGKKELEIDKKTKKKKKIETRRTTDRDGGD